MAFRESLQPQRRQPAERALPRKALCACWRLQREGTPSRCSMAQCRMLTIARVQNGSVDSPMPQDTTKQGGRIFADTIHLQLLKARQMPWQRIKALSQWALKRDHVRRLIGQPTMVTYRCPLRCGFSASVYKLAERGKGSLYFLSLLHVLHLLLLFPTPVVTTPK